MKINVLHVFGNFDVHRGGAQRVAVDIINNSSVPQNLLVLCGDGSLIKKIAFIGNVKLLGQRKIKIIKSIMEIRRYIIKHKITTVHVHAPSIHLISKIALIGLSRVKLIVTVHNTNYRKSTRIQERYLLPFADTVVASSNEVMKFAKKLVNRKVVNLNVIHNGIEVSTFDQNYARVEAIERSYFFKGATTEHDNSFVIFGFVGRLVEQKNLSLLIEQFSVAKRQHSSMGLVIVGDGPELLKLKNLVKTLGLDDNSIVFTGYTDESLKILKSFDVFCMTSKWEGLSIALLEAMLAGKPIITTDLPIFREILGDDEFTFNSQSVCNHMVELAENYTKRMVIGNKMRNRALEKFSAKVMVDKYSELYRRIN